MLVSIQNGNALNKQQISVAYFSVELTQSH